MLATTTFTSPGESRGRALSPWLIIGLAALAVPRVVAHDLELVAPGSIANLLLVFVPPLIWLAVVLWQHPPRPFLTYLLIGVCYGIMLAVGHQIMWTEVFGDSTPSLGITGLAPTAETLIVRAFAFVSSMVTGTMIGVVVGIVGTLLARLQTTFTRS